jgi:hypothetical protein
MIKRRSLSIQCFQVIEGFPGYLGDENAERGQRHESMLLLALNMTSRQVYLGQGNDVAI